MSRSRCSRIVWVLMGLLFLGMLGRAVLAFQKAGPPGREPPLNGGTKSI